MTKNMFYLSESEMIEWFCEYLGCHKDSIEGKSVKRFIIMTRPDIIRIKPGIYRIPINQIPKVKLIDPKPVKLNFFQYKKRSKR
jgi:hypothetical protein